MGIHVQLTNLHGLRECRGTNKCMKLMEMGELYMASQTRISILIKPTSWSPQLFAVSQIQKNKQEIGKKKMRIEVGGIVLLWMVSVPMGMGQLDLGSMLDRAKEAGISQETIQLAAKSDAAKQALQDGTAQQALNDAKDAVGDTSDGGSTWSDWVQSNIGLGEGGPAPSPEDSDDDPSLVGDIEISPSPSPSNSPEGSSPSPSPSLSSPLQPPSSSPILSPSSSFRSTWAPTPAPSPSLSPSSSPSPSVEAPEVAEEEEEEEEEEEGPTSAPSLAPEAE